MKWVILEITSDFTKNTTMQYLTGGTMLYKGYQYKYLVEVAELKAESPNIVFGYSITMQCEMQVSVILL